MLLKKKQRVILNPRFCLLMRIDLKGVCKHANKRETAGGHFLSAAALIGVSAELHRCESIQQQASPSVTSRCVCVFLCVQWSWRSTCRASWTRPTPSTAQVSSRWSATTSRKGWSGPESAAGEQPPLPSSLCLMRMWSSTRDGECTFTASPVATVISTVKLQAALSCYTRVVG